MAFWQVNQPCALFIGEDVKLRLNSYNAASDSHPHKGAIHAKGKLGSVRHKTAQPKPCLPGGDIRWS